MAKYQRRKIHKPDNPSFQWDVIDFNAKSKEYTIKNRVTGEKRTLTKKQMLELQTKEGADKK
jgi:hypothetical protein